MSLIKEQRSVQTCIGPSSIYDGEWTGPQNIVCPEITFRLNEIENFFITPIF